MAIFYLVFFKVLSSLLSVFLGFLAGRISKIDKDSISSLLFYFIAPVVFFAIPTSAELSISAMFISLLMFSLSFISGVFHYWLYGKLWQDSHRNILALSAGTGNCAYVVFPIATAIFDDHTLSLFVLGLIGIVIYEASVGCYFCARSMTTFKQSILKVAKLPILNAFFLGCIMSLMGFHLPDFFDEFVKNMKGAFAILGMVVIGVALSEVNKFTIDFKFIGAAFFSKFVFYPLLVNIVILIDSFTTKYLDTNYQNAIQLLSIAPMATNTIVLSSLYKIYPHKVATSVLISFFFVLIYMPVMSTLMLQDVNL